MTSWCWMLVASTALGTSYRQLSWLHTTYRLWMNQGLHPCKSTTNNVSHNSCTFFCCECFVFLFGNKWFHTIYLYICILITSLALGQTSDCHWPLTRYIKLRVAHAPGMPGTFSPPPRVSNPDMYHGTWVTHVPWCMLGSPISWRETFPAHAQPTIVRIR